MTTTITAALPTAKALADEFAARLYLYIGRVQFEEVLRRNPTYGEACASHDFCDANEAMLEAFQELIPDVDAEAIMASDEMTALWNEAWAIAKASAFAEHLALVKPN